jgi:uncharacterized protein YceH (UPF0502 family)
MKTSAGAKERAPQTTPVDDAPPLAPHMALDVVHLARMTLGERTVEREVLELFDRQAAMLLQRMVAEPPKVVAAFAHTLCGSARGIGAWKVAEAAEAVERCASQNAAVGLSGAVERLRTAVEEARAAIVEHLRTH